MIDSNFLIDSIIQMEVSLHLQIQENLDIHYTTVFLEPGTFQPDE